MDFTTSQDWNYAIWGIIGLGVVLVGLLVVKLFEGSDYSLIGETASGSNDEASSSSQASSKRKNKKGSKDHHKKKKGHKGTGSGEQTGVSKSSSRSSLSSLEEERESLQGELSSSNQRLFTMFLTVLSEGVSLVKHDEGSSAKIILRMDYAKKVLFYKPFAGWAPRKKAIKLADLVEVLPGKQSEAFQSKRLGEVDETLCLSLVLTSGIEVNLQANSGMERDALVRGFTMLMEKEKGEGEEKVGSFIV